MNKTDGMVAQRPKVRVQPVNREQMVMESIDIEKLIEEDHPIRAIWELTGMLKIEKFYEDIKAVEQRVVTQLIPEF